jgi:hypothetical protein
MDWREGFDESLLDEEALEYLVENELGTKASGITKQVINKGLGSLTGKQAYVFKTEVVEVWLGGECKSGHSVEGHELIGVWVNDGYCGSCAERMSKGD